MTPPISRRPTVTSPLPSSSTTGAAPTPPPSAPPPPATTTTAPVTTSPSPPDAQTLADSRAQGLGADALARARVPAPETPARVPAPTSTAGRDLVHRLAPETTERYQRAPNGHTRCNTFTNDYLRERGVPTDDNPFQSDHHGSLREANPTADWLADHGAEHHWHSVSAEEAQAWVNQGGVGMIDSRNSAPGPHGIHGHVAPIIEGMPPEGQVRISNAGSRNFEDGNSQDSGSFAPSRHPEFWIYQP